MLKRLKIILTGVPLFFCSFLWPKRKNLWLFGAWFGEKYSDNSRYLFEFVSNNYCATIEAWWVSSNPDVIKEVRGLGFNAIHAYSFKGLVMQFRAKAFFCTVNSFDFAPFVITPRSLFVQLWHGIPLKAILLQTLKRGSLKYWAARLRLWLVDRYALIVSPNKFTDKQFSEAFACKEKQLFRAGYPRCAPLLDKEQSVEQLRGVFCSAEQTLWFYLPTHRNEGRSHAAENIAVTRQLIDMSPEFARRNIVLIVKAHYYESRYFSGLRGSDHVKVLHELPADLYYCLGVADGLVTDYSSVMWDFSVREKPVVLLAYDEDAYANNDRGLAFNCDAICDNVIRTPAKLPGMLQALDNVEGSGMKMGFEDEAKGHGQSERIVKEILTRLKLKR